MKAPRSSHAVLAWLQQTLERLHDVQTELDVRAFVVDDVVRSALPGANPALPEQLFVQRGEDDHVDLALYIAPRIMAQLTHDHPLAQLHRGNLESYCIALEGVSHFVMLIWKARYGQPVTALELEIQAEVDKFVASWLLLQQQGHGAVETGRLLSRVLFGRYRMRGGLTRDEHHRYQTASRVARSYCEALTRRFARTAQRRNLKQDVRRFYRRSLSEKLRSG